MQFVQIRWKKINNYCIGFKEINISKAIVNENQRFILWQGDKLINIYKTSQEAKNDAMALIKTEPTLFS